MRFFETTEELREKVSIAAGLSFERWQACEEEAISQFLEPFFGQPLVANILSWKNSVNTSEKTAHDYVAHALAKFIIRVYTDVGEVMLTDTGITRTETSDTKTAYAQQVLSLKTSLEEDGYTALETAITYLYTNFTQFANWLSSPYMTQIKGRVMDTPAELNAVRKLSTPALIFYYLQPDLERAELTLLESHFPEEVVSELRIKKTDELDAKYKALKKHVVQFIAAEALYNCIESQILTITPKGVKLITKDYNQAKASEEAAPSSFLNMQLKNLKKSVNLFLNQARIYLLTYKEDFGIETSVETYNRTRPWM